jgi:type IV fimbrial biogenesis protein FimT
MRQPACFAARVRGYSLVETLVALGISGVMATIGLPQMTDNLARRSVDSAILSLSTALRLARAEALKRGETVTVCPRDPRAGDSATICASSGRDWSAGWLVFVDRGERGSLGDADLLLWSHLPPRQAPKVDGTIRYYSFQASGVSLNAASHVDFLPNGREDSPSARRVCINKPGRLRALSRLQECAA